MTEPVAPAGSDPRAGSPAPSPASAGTPAAGSRRRILVGSTTAAAAGLLGAGAAWLLLSRELARGAAAYLALTGTELGIGIGDRTAEIRDFGMLVAGLGLLAWLVGARPGRPGSVPGSWRAGPSWPGSRPSGSR